MVNTPYSIGDLRKAENIQILHPQFKTALDRLNHFHELWKAGATARNLLLAGPSGTGKTSVLRSFCAAHPGYQTDEAQVLPTLYVQVPASPTIRSLAESILIALGAGMQMRGSAAEKTNQVVQLMRACRTELLILDDFHHFIDSGHKTFEEVTEWLKILIDTLAIPTVLSGLPECELILRSNEQLRRRFAARVSLSAIGFANAKEKALFRDILHSWDTQINHGRDLWGLAEKERVHRMHYATNGLIGYAAKIILGTLDLLIVSGSNELTDEVLQESFHQNVWSDSVDELNPFHALYMFRRLNQAGEPYEPTRFTLKAKQAQSRIAV